MEIVVSISISRRLTSLKQCWSPTLKSVNWMGATQTTPPSHHLWAWFQSHTSKQILCTSFYGSLPATWNPENQSGFFAGCATGFRHAESSVKICSRAVGSDFPQTASVYKSHLFISTTVGTLTEKMFTPCSEMKALQNLPNSKNSTQTFMFSLGLAKKIIQVKHSPSTYVHIYII